MGAREFSGDKRDPVGIEFVQIVLGEEILELLYIIVRAHMDAALLIDEAVLHNLFDVMEIAREVPDRFGNAARDH